MPPFWKTVPLSAMKRREWESLCDGCAKCCLVKLVDEEASAPASAPEDTLYTTVACRLLDLGTCTCTRYRERSRLVPDCVRLTPETLPQVAHWLPATCAYRLIWEGKDLPWWHPLVSGEEDSVHRAGASLRGAMISESEVREDELEDHIVPRRRIDASPKP